MKTKLRQVLFLILTVVASTVYGLDIPSSDEIQIPLVEKSLNYIKTHPGTEGESLSLERSISRALNNNPELKASELLIRASQARASQERMFPNPELELEFDNFAGSGDLGGTKSTETTIGVGQVIELGKKRSHRFEIAKKQTDIDILSHELLALELITDVRIRFTEVLGAQQRVDLDKKLLDLSSRFNSTIDTLVKAGRYSPAEKARAQVDYSTLQINAMQNERYLDIARLQLAATYGESIITEEVTGALLSPTEELIGLDPQLNLEEYPQVQLLKREVGALQAEAQLAKAMRIPDPTLGAGFRRFNESKDRAFIASLSIPIPLLNRNQGGIEEARYKVESVEQSVEAIKVSLLSQIMSKQELIGNLDEILKMMSEIVLPEASRAYEIISRNYRLGQYSTLDVLDAQRKLFEAQATYLDTQIEYNIAIIELEGLTGHSVLNQ